MFANFNKFTPLTQHTACSLKQVFGQKFVGTVVKEEHSGRYTAHDAFSSLVDVASSAPSLPVPKEENRRVCLPRGK